MSIKLNDLKLTVKVIKPAEIQATKSGKQKATVRAVQNTRRFNQQTQQWEDVGTPLWIDLVCWSNGGDKDWTFDKIMKADKQDELLVEGELSLDEWEDKNGGGKRSKHFVTVRKVQIVKSKADSGGGVVGGGDSGFPDESAGPFAPTSEIPFAWLIPLTGFSVMSMVSSMVS
jgi:single-stranded DNA-binding protein